ncbi:MAG: transcription-repair coupling factor [Gemmatimonadota bacterium]|nr:MAG: transcription-repair coupling factor [Gemmatimonadota bacterium]
MLPLVLDWFRGLSATRGLIGQLPDRGELLAVAGLPGAAGAALVAVLSEEQPQRTFLVVAATPADAERWHADLTVLLGEAARLYPQREALGEEEPHFEIAGERVETIWDLLQGRARVLLTTLPATVELTRMARAVVNARVDLRRDESVDMSSVIDRLEQMGYERTASVLDVAQFAVRGGIVDVYGFGMSAPARIEWWGNTVASLRAFDLDTQRSQQEIDRVSLLPVAPLGSRPGAEVPDDGIGLGIRQSLLDLLPPDTLVVTEPAVDTGAVRRVWDEAQHHLKVAMRRGEDVPARSEVFLSPEAWSERWSRLARLAIAGESEGGCRTRESLVAFDLRPPPEIGRDMKRLARAVRGAPTLILCDNEGQLERLEELLSESDRPGERLAPDLTLALGSLSGGFVLPGLTVLTDHEIFRRARRIRRARRYRQATVSDSVGSLTPGDYVVHLEHGIGVYRGMQTIELGGGAEIEVAVLEYEGGDRLNVPLYGLDQIEPYRVAGDDESRPPPRIDRLGGTRWRRQRAKTEAAIRQLAAELLELYARRQVARGFAFPPDTRWQRELESSFLYEDTPDQRRATEETKRDMERSQPADRLVVGDVGYGKTEVAVRAAFKAAQASKQVAVLVPTTILAEQHGRTMGERLAEYPVRVEVLSRFRTAAEQRNVLQGIAQGTVDVVIGTHRLLSPDVVFRDLGLLVVDEEHRFGVKHKERLKALRLEVDIITLTATPIPRTLHMALSGLRDLTLIETAPRDRSPVLTFVEPWDDELLEEVLARELDRAGQTYFVHNRIETIQTVGERVRRLLPRGRGVVEIAHGRMRERDLDAVMRRFVAGEIDVLVSTMIVESGLDVTNANTMIVHQADQCGLAQLYQLRGRVGRGHRRAYCYLLVPDNVQPEAERRLKVLEHHTELGSGYRIALRDLELRGAGNLLGAEQSGHAHAVGFDLFMRWLNETVRALKGGQPGEEAPAPEVILDAPAYLPEAYVPDDDAKLEFYRRLARSGQLCEIGDLRDELRDRFGPLPEQAERLLVVSELRRLGAKLGIEAIIVRGDEARLKFRTGTAPRLTRLASAMDEVQFAADVRRTVPLYLRLTRLGGVPIDIGLVRALAAVSGPDGASTDAAASEAMRER